MEIKSVGIENPNRVVEVDRFDSAIGGRTSAPGPSVGSDAHSFGQLLEKMVDQTNASQIQADEAIKELVAGRSKNIHETMLTIEKADTSLKLMMQVRNKVLDAYREIMRMQV